MANRLTKRADIIYTPAVPYQPAVPAYCVLIPYTIPGYFSPGEPVVTTNPNGTFTVTVTPSKYVPPKTAYREQCFPAIPERQGVPATTTYLDKQGWNGGARSIAQLSADGYASFKIGSPCAAVVCGFSVADFSTLPSEQSHAIFVTGTTVKVMEYGVEVHTASISHDPSNVYKIERRGTTVIYSCGAWSYTSAIPITGAVLLDASLYSSIDYVDSPMLVAENLSATMGGSMKPMQGSSYDNSTYSDCVGTFGSMDGVANAYVLVTAGGSMRALTGVAAESSTYNYAEGSMQPMTGSGDGGFPVVSIASCFGAIPPMAGVALSLTGEIGNCAGSFGVMSGWSADAHGYAECVGSMQPMYGYSDSGWPVPNEVFETEVLLLGDYFLAVSTPIGEARSVLQLGDYYTDTILIQGTIYDALLLGDSVTPAQALTAMIMDGLELSTDLSNINFDDVTSPRIVGSQPIQYAVNALTGALTTYSNFGFGAFANVGGTTYGSKKDGVYVLRQGDDDGTPITVEIDMGSSNFGSPLTKVIESVSMAITTDAQVYIKLRADDGDEIVYRLDDRGSMMRTLTAKGVSGRRWNLNVQIIDAHHMELEQVEQRVAVSTRRWSR